MLSALCLPFKSVRFMFSFICECRCDCVCSSTYSRGSHVPEDSSYLFLHFFSSSSSTLAVMCFFCWCSCFGFVSAHERIHFNSWLFTLEVRAMDRMEWIVSIALLVWFGLKDWLCAYFAFSQSNARQSEVREKERVDITSCIAAKCYKRAIYLLSLPCLVLWCWCANARKRECPKPAKNAHLYFICVASNRGIYECQSSTVYGIRN